MVIDWWDTDCEGLGVAVTRDDLETLAARIDAALREARAEALEAAADRLWKSEYGAVSGTLRAMAATERGSK
jgi:hypothetical protein